MDDGVDLDRQRLVEVLNLWPKLIGLSPTQLQIWTMLYIHDEEGVSAADLSRAIFGDATPVHMQILRLRRALEELPWSIKTIPRREGRGTYYRLIHSEKG